MTLGVRRPVGFDFGAAADKEDCLGGGGNNVDTLWEQRKRLPGPEPTLCTLNTNCVDVPETWTDAVASEEASCGGRAQENGIQGGRCSDEAESVVECVEFPRLGRKRSRGRLRNKKPDTVKASANAGAPTGSAVSQPSLTPLGAREADGTEVSKNSSIVTCEVDDNSELEVVELELFDKAAEIQDSSASCIPAKGQKQDCATKVGSKKSPSNAALRRSPQLVKYTAHTNGLNPMADLPKLSKSPRTPTPLGSDACNEQCMGSKFVWPSAFTEKEKSPGSSATLEFGGANVGLLNSSSDSRSMEGHNVVSQRQSFQLAKENHQGNERELSVVLALPHFSSNHRTSHTMEFLNDSSTGACKANSLRSQAPGPVIFLDKVRSRESSGIWKPSYVETLKCSGEGKLMKKRVKVSGRQSAQQLMEDTIHGNAYDQSEPSVLPELKGSLTTQKEALETVEVMRYTDKLEGPQDISGVSKEEGPTIKNLGKKKEQYKGIVTRKMVKETLRLFQAICRRLLREEETKAREACHNNRVDVMALNLIKEKGKCLNASEHHFGSVPGVEIGDEFHYRAELSIIGLHRNIMAGINYSKHDGMYVASSIVFYESYFDFLERSDVLLYTGPSGKPSYSYQNKNEKHLRDEKLERGNLALKNNMDVQIPIRVVLGRKGSKDTNCRLSKAKGSVTYVYDGLYLVEKYWPEMGNHGVSVFKFQLRRMPGQRQLAIKEIQNSKGFGVQREIHMQDISQGKENIPVSLVNTIDDKHPLPFIYINKVVYPSWHKMISPKGCDCTDGCSDSVNCACAVKNGGDIPFNYDGAIVEAKPLVYECGPSCKCPPSCHNRVSQHGIKYPLEIFKTKSMGWGVRSLTSIPSGSFICEYIGEMIEESEANKRTNDDYLFDIGQNYHDDALWEGLSTCVPGLQQDASCEVVEDDWFTIDAANCGNIGRFINHCCTPNLYAQNVLYDHDDKRMPHIMFFAAENISPLEELTYHYNYTIDQVHDVDGNIKKKDCYCGSAGCTGRLY